MKRFFAYDGMRFLGAAMASVILALCLTAASASVAHAATAGWKLTNKNTKLVYVQKDGKKAASRTIDGIKLGADGYAVPNVASKLKIAVMKNVKRITKPGMTKRQKLYECYLDVLHLHYVNHEPSYYGERGWMPRFALSKINSRNGECIYAAVLVAYYAYELGYKNVGIWGEPNGHAFTIVGNKAIDMNYALFMGAPKTPTRGKTKWIITSWGTTSPKGMTKTQKFFKGKNGLVEYKNHYYFVEKGVPVKETWKKVEGTKYYFDEKGRAVTGAAQVGSKWYVFSAKGKLLTGTKTREVTVKGARYRVKKDGRAAKGWNAAHTKYFLVTGAKAKGLCCVNGQVTVFSSTGAYNAEKTAQLRKLAVVGGRAEELITALGAIEAPTVANLGASCSPLKEELGVDGTDRSYTYSHLEVDVLVSSDGSLYLEGIGSR